MNDLSQTAILLQKIVDGDKSATDELVEQCYPLLLKWAHGRIPYSEKSLLETTDLVQESIIRGIGRIEHFKSLKAGAFLAYLRKIFINCINESIRKSKPTENIDDFLNRCTHFSTELNVDEYIYYEKALEKLTEQEQQAIILKIEFGFTYADIANELDKPSEDAVRMYISRALLKLANFLKND